MGGSPPASERSMIHVPHDPNNPAVRPDLAPGDTETQRKILSQRLRGSGAQDRGLVANGRRGIDPPVDSSHIFLAGTGSGKEEVMNGQTGEIIPITSKRNREARRFLKEAILLIPRLLLLLYRLLRDPRVSRADKILAGAVLAYVANPLDLIPDFVPLAGQVDDLFAVSLVLMRLIADS